MIFTVPVRLKLTIDDQKEQISDNNNYGPMRQPPANAAQKNPLEAVFGYIFGYISSSGSEIEIVDETSG